MNDLARILGLAGLATEQSVASPANRELKEYDIISLELADWADNWAAENDVNYAPHEDYGVNDLADEFEENGVDTEEKAMAYLQRMAIYNEPYESVEEGCPCCGGGRCTCKGDCPDCNCHGNNEWDESIEEAYPWGGDEDEDDENHVGMGVAGRPYPEEDDDTSVESADVWQTRKGKWANSQKGGFASADDAQAHYDKYKKSAKKTKVPLSKLKPIEEEKHGAKKGYDEVDESVEEAAYSYVDILSDDLPDGIHYDFNNLPKVNWSQYSKEDIEKFVEYLYNMDFDDYEGHFGGIYIDAIRWIEKNILELSEGKSKPDFRDVDGDGDTEESWKDAEEDKEEMKESKWCGVCGNDVCSCTDTMVESPTMDTTQLVIMMRNAGLSEETITQKLEEWANTPEGVGEVEPTAHGDAYDFAQSVNLSLKRYLDAQDMKVQVTEHKVENMKALYAAHKAKK